MVSRLSRVHNGIKNDRLTAADQAPFHAVRRINPRQLQGSPTDMARRSRFLLGHSLPPFQRSRFPNSSYRIAGLRGLLARTRSTMNHDFRHQTLSSLERKINPGYLDGDSNCVFDKILSSITTYINSVIWV